LLRPSDPPAISVKFERLTTDYQNLAQRAASAAKEIKTLIADSVTKVETGSARVTQSGATLGEIVASVKRVSDIIGEIAAATHEQTAGIDEVSRAVTRMDQVVQANAAQSEEVSTTAEALARQSAHLQALVGRFRIQRDAVTAAVRAPAREKRVASPVAPRTGQHDKRHQRGAAPAAATTPDPSPEPVLVGRMLSGRDVSRNGREFEEF
jgi:methyl-accepting chemotaxis protein